MNPGDVQLLLKEYAGYTGTIDGIYGPQSRRAIDNALSTTPMLASWLYDRRGIAAAQVLLNEHGFEAGKVDGLAGVNTNEAFRAWQHEKTTGRPLRLDRTPPPGYTPRATSFPSQARVAAFYGAPGTNRLINQLRMFALPLPMRIDWDLDTTVTRVQLHQKCGDSAMTAILEVIRHYGEKRWRELGLDRNAGTYNPRKMRGGTSWSMHAYGCAWDFFAGPNGLTTRCPQALFCGQEYQAFFDIWEKHGWTSLGRAIGRDWMHVQAAHL